MHPPLLTVIICTYNRSFILAECLESLCAQESAPENFSVLVINNNSTDETLAVASGFTGRLPGLRVVTEMRQGLSHARNRGIEETRTEWAAFLDDDAKARPDWVNTILETIDRKDFDAFGGPYYAWHRFGPPPPWFDDAWETFEPTQEYGIFSDDELPAGGNCALKHDLVSAFGGFPADLGMAGGKCAYGEETALFAAMVQAGRRVGYVPGMRIDHCVMPYKYGIRWRLASLFARGKANFSVQRHPSLPVALAKALCRTALECVKTAWAALWGALQGFPTVHKRRIMEQASRAAFAFGRLYETINECRRTLRGNNPQNGAR